MPAPTPPSTGFEPRALLGATLDGRYELSAHLATGGMGAVFRARHVHLRKDVAVKVLRPELSASPDLVERFRREAEIASALQHENIVHVTDFGRSESGTLYLVMELLLGESLFDRLRREGLLSPEEVVGVLWQVCAGLEAAHAMGVVHRDLKPENVFLARTGSGREVAKLLDFGIAKFASPASGADTQAGMVVGTPEYLAPEQATGSPVDGRADLYAVGLIAWRMLAGRHPFQAEDARGLLMMQATRPVPPLASVRPDLVGSPALLAAIDRACAKDPGERHPTAGALRDDLAASLGAAFVPPASATPAPEGARPPPLAFATCTTFELLSPAAPVAAPALAGARALLGELRASPRAALRRLAGRAAAAARRGAARAVGLARAGAAAARAHRGAAAGAAAGLLVLLALVGGLVWSWGRPAAQARAYLAADRPADARAVLEAALRRRPEDLELLLLRGRALHRLPGAVADGIDAYQQARAAGPLDAVALGDLAQDLGRERSLADRAARVLREVGDPAVPALLAAAQEGAGVQRLRALALLRDLGAEERVDRVAAYGALLEDPECDVRRAAARRLGELGDPAALEALAQAAEARVERRGLFGLVSRTPACGAAEAAEAARRIEAVR